MPRNASRFLIVLGAALLAAAPGLSAQQSGQPIRGDVDGDGRVTAADARIVANYLVGRAVPAGADVAGRGDANGDGRVTAADVAVINAFAVGRDMKRFPVGTPIGVVPSTPKDGLAAILCGADVRSKTVKCDAPAGAGATGARGVLLGNQHVYVELASSNVSSVDNSGTIDFTFDVTVKNLIPQTLGVDSATGAANPEGVRVFFATAPVADAGSGEIDVLGGGMGTFTASNQHYYQYPAPLKVDSVTGAVNWHFQMPNTVTHFQFLVYVAGKVQFPQGWIDIYPPSHPRSPTLIPTNTIPVGSTLQLEDTARTQVGNPIPGESVKWSSTGHATTVDSLTGLVTATGVGTDTITATGNSGRTGKVQIVVTAGAPATMTANSATTQTANAGSAVSAPPSVIVKDALNNPVPGVSVTFTAAAGAGTVSDGSTTGSTVTITTNASGIATLTSWTVGNTVGVDSVTASSTGLTDVVFTATVTPGAPASMTANSAVTQSDTVGKPVAAPPSVLVKDALGNPVPGVTVTFNVTAGGGSVNNGSTSGASVTVNTDASGIATLTSWTLGTTSGTSNNTVVASATGVSDVTFTATAEPDVPFTIAKTAGDNQTVTAGTAVPIAPAVHITDQYGNVVATGTAVTFTPSAGGSVTGGSTSTDASGNAAVGSWTLAAGANTLGVASGSATATFNGYGNSLPVAGRDSMDAVGNVVVTATGMKGNDSDADGDAIDITPGTFSTAQGGSVTLTAAGGVTYTPAVGFVGIDSVAYTLTDARGGSVQGKLVMRLPDRFWFVTGGGSGNGTQASPSGNFTFGAPIAAKDSVFLLTSATVSTGLTLPNGGALIGAGAAGLPITRSLGGSANMTVNPVTLLTSGSQPTLTVTTGTGVTLASSGTGYVVNGLNLTSSAGAGLAGTTFGTLAVGNLAVSATGGPALNLATGTVSGTFTSVSGSGSSTQGAILSAVGGKFAVSGGTITGSASGAALQVSGSATGRVDWAGSLVQSNTQPLLLVTGHSGADTLNLTGGLSPSAGSRGLTFDNADGVYLIIPPSPTTFTGDSVGVDILNGSSGIYTFGANLTLNGTAGNAFNLDASSAGVTFSGNITKNGTQTGRLVSVTTHTLRTLTFSGTLTASSTNVGSTGILLDNADGTYNFSGTNTLGGAGSDAGIDVQNGSLATVTFSSNTTVTNPVNEAVRIDASPAGLGFTYNGTISKTNGSGTGISLTNNGTGNINFAGPSIVLNTGASAGINMTSTGATVGFVDSVKVTTTTGNGINATGGGTLTVAGTHNSISSAGGIALNVSGTTVGATGLNFRSISATGGANGIVLSGTGTQGGLTVSGSGTAGSGGSITNSAGANLATAGNGVYLNGARNVSLSWMSFSGQQNSGIYGTGVRGFTLNKARFTGTIGDSNNGTCACNESAVQLVDVGGPVKLTNSRFDGAAYNAVRIENISGTAPALDSLVFDSDTVSTMQGSTADVRGTALLVNLGDGTADTRIRNNRITVWWGNAIDVLVQGTASGTTRITNNFADNTNGALAGAGGIGVTGGNHAYNISGNTVRHTNGTAISADRVSAGALFNGTIDGNFVGVSGDANSGSFTGIGIFASHHGPGTTTTKISNNVLRQINGSASGAITTVTGDALAFGGSGTMNATISGNNIQESGTTVNNAQQGILITHGVQSGPPNDTDQGCYDILNNTVINFVSGTANNRLRVNQRFGTTSRFPGYTGAATGDPSETDLATYLLGRNTASTSTNNNTSTGGFLNTSPAGSACPQPTL